MDLESFRACCLDHPSASEDSPFGENVLVWRIGGKLFALTDVTRFPPAVNLKCDPERAIELRERYEGVLPGYHQNKRHWNTVLLDGSVPDAEIRAMIDHSYEIVRTSLKKSVREGL
jgi:predicted DNA-binding protein (MmcQ/YjbR family)